MLTARLKCAFHKAEAGLLAQFPGALVLPAIARLKRIFQNLDYTTPRKSVVIALSPFVEKVYYLNIAVPERVAVGEPFSFRNLALNKKEEKSYLLLVMDEASARIYHGIDSRLQLILFNALAPAGEKPTANEETATLRKHSVQKTNNTLQAIDQSLACLQDAYGLPVIVMAKEDVLPSFKSITKNGSAILHYVHTKRQPASTSAIQQALEPVLKSWKKLQANFLFAHLEQQLFAGRLSVGIADVWKASKERRCKILLVEKDFSYPTFTVDDQKMIYCTDVIPANHSYMATDAVEEVIEAVLAGGGDVLFVEPGTLKDYLHIALF